MPCLIRNGGQQRKLVSTEAVTPFPLVSIAVQPRDRDVVENAVVCSVLPDRRFHSGKPDLVNRLAIGRRFRLGLLGLGCGFGGHFKFLLSSEEDLVPAPKHEEQVSGTRETTSIRVVVRCRTAKKQRE